MLFALLMSAPYTRMVLPDTGYSGVDLLDYDIDPVLIAGKSLKRSAALRGPMSSRKRSLVPPSKEQVLSHAEEKLRQLTKNVNTNSTQRRSNLPINLEQPINVILTQIDERLSAVEAAIGTSSDPMLTVDRSTFLTSVSQGALIATLSAPFGAGTVYEVVGTLPGQLALASGGRIVAGSDAPAANAQYSITVRAGSADGQRAVTKTFGFTAERDATARAAVEPYIGVNLSGAEFQSFSINNIPSNAAVDYWAADVGITAMRFPIVWNLWQPTHSTPLDPNYTAAVVERVRRFFTGAPNGSKFIIDLHTYEPKQFTLPEFRDFWNRVAAAMVANFGASDLEHIEYDLLNEPKRQADSGVTSDAEWLAYANEGIAGIRDAGATGVIWVPFMGPNIADGLAGRPWDGFVDGIVDPLDKIVLTVHQYVPPLDNAPDAVGDPRSAPDSTPQSFSQYALADSLAFLTGQARRKGFRLALGETGVGSGTSAEYAAPGFNEDDLDTQSLRNADNGLTFVQANSDVWYAVTWWGGGFPSSYHPVRNTGGFAYRIGLEPIGGVEQPQVKVLRRFLPGGDKFLQPKPLAIVGPEYVASLGTYDGTSGTGMDIGGSGWIRSNPREITWEGVINWDSAVQANWSNSTILNGSSPLVKLKMRGEDQDLMFFSYVGADNVYRDANFGGMLQRKTNGRFTWKIVTDNSTGIRVYLDGLKVYEDPQPLRLDIQGYIYQSDFAGPFAGRLRSMGVWGYAHSDGVVQENYTGMEEGLTYYYNFDQDPYARCGPADGVLSTVNGPVAGSPAPVIPAAPQQAATRYLRLSNSAGQGATTPNNGTAITDGFALVEMVLRSDMPTPTNNLLFGSGGSDGNGEFGIYLNGDRTIFGLIVPAGGGAIAYPGGQAVLFPLGQEVTLRAAMNSGSADVTIDGETYRAKRFVAKLSVDGGATYTRMFDAPIETGAFGSSDALWRVGTHRTAENSAVDGYVAAVTVRNSAGAVVLNPDFRAQPVGTTSFTDGAGNAWTVLPASQIVDRN